MKKFLTFELLTFNLTKAVFGNRSIYFVSLTTKFKALDVGIDFADFFVERIFYMGVYLIIGIKVLLVVR